MKVEFKKKFHIGSFFFNATAREADHQKLARHIINLNQQNSIQDIIHEVSVNLKELLNYRQYAFVLKRKTGIDVWLDSRMYSKSLESVLMEDFRLDSETAINYLNHTFHNDEEEHSFNLENLVTYDLSEGTCQAKIYMLPNLNTPSYNNDVVCMLLKSTGIALAKQMNIEQLTNVATRDPLTECYNRREFEIQMNKAIAHAKSYRTPLSIFMFNIDHFKTVNDTYGTQAGDAVLKEVSSLVQANIRNNDVLARYSGEQFIVILPSTEKRQGMEIADRLRQEIENIVTKADSHDICVTASFGIASLNTSYKKTDSSDMLSLIEDADSMMYKAKLNGSNTVMPGLLQLCNSSQARVALTGTI